VPDVSAIVPARDAAATIGRTLAALAAQTLERERYEVIVVDDASDDGTAAIAERAGVRVVRLAGQAGPAAARNAGVAAARAPVLAFTDADCEPAPEWLAAGLAALEAADLVTGRIAATPGVPVRAFDRALRIDGPSPRFESANVFTRRSTFDAAGGFRRLERGGPSVAEGHFGEDALFGWRARRSGARVAYAPAALVHHAVFPRGPRAYVAERRRLRFFPALVREAPELRATLTLRLFLTPRSARFDLALAALAAAALARRPWLALGAAPYVRRHLRTDQPWRRSVARHNAAELSADLVGLAALLWGSARARTLLL
jgi:glycosyltransferase involved in cell wall biosynthesis